jgi:hypothetical protein
MKLSLKILVIFSVIGFLNLSNANAQEEGRLYDQYQNMIENSETFEKYKVIPITKVKSFGEALNDTISDLKQKVVTANNAKQEAVTERDSAQSKMIDAEEELEEVQGALDEMPLFGIPMTKTI